MTPIRRIESARAALTSATCARGTRPALAEDEVIDLLIDIRHLCDAAGLDYARCHYLARGHYQHEMGSAS
jgi:hypothetical protein